MGADMLVECFWEEIDKKRLAVRKPDWNKGKARIKELCSKWFADGELPSEVDFLADMSQDIEKQVKTVQSVLNGYLKNAEEAYTGNNREITSLEFPPVRIFLTGGMSYGDSPSALFNELGTLTQLEILEATGLNPTLPCPTQWQLSRSW